MPRVVLALVTVIGGLELLFSAAETGLAAGLISVDSRQAAIQGFSFYEPLLVQQFSVSILGVEWYRLISYAFVHSHFTSAVFSAVFVLAFGNLLARNMPALHVLGIFFAGTVVGALTFALFLDARYPLLGSSPGFFAMFGGILGVMFVTSGGQVDRRLLSIPLFLIGLQVIARLVFGGPDYWLADIAGCLAGLIGGVFSRLGIRPGLRFLFQRIMRR